MTAPEERARRWRLALGGAPEGEGTGYRLGGGDGAIDAALGKARDHAAKAGDALDGAEGLSPDVCTALTRLVRGLVDRDS